MKINKFKIILSSAIIIFFLSTYLYIDKTESAFGNIITFFSIIIGFCVTALSIISTSNFANDLYKKEDSEDNSKTLLHNLVDAFTKCALGATLTIILILLSYYLTSIEFCKLQFLATYISGKTIIIGSIWYLSIATISLFIRLIFLFSNFTIQNAKRNNK